MVKGLKHLLC